MISAPLKSQPTSTEQQKQLPPSRQPLLLSIRAHPIWTVVSGIVVAVGLLSSIATLLGAPPWPVDPEIHFRDTNDGSSLILPFDIINKSAFRMPSVSFRCGVQFVWAVDSLGHRTQVWDTVFVNGTRSVATTATFDCNAADLLKIKADGSLAFRNSASKLQSRSRVAYQAPWRTIKMCIWVGGEYKFMGFWPVEFTSHMFQWPAKAGSHQWREGPFIGDRPIEEIEEEKWSGLVPGSLACPDERTYPYMLVEGAGLALLVFDPKTYVPPLGAPPWP
jgi:hypothetical protein